MRTHEIHRQTCPICDALVECVRTPGEAPPSPGDLNVCSVCAGLLLFGADLHLVKMTDEDFAALDPDSRDTLLEARSYVIQSHRGPFQMVETTPS